jgi:hypothetical protein
VIECLLSVESDLGKEVLRKWLTPPPAIVAYDGRLRNRRALLGLDWGTVNSSSTSERGIYGFHWTGDFPIPLHGSVSDALIRDLQVVVRAPIRSHFPT